MIIMNECKFLIEQMGLLKVNAKLRATRLIRNNFLFQIGCINGPRECMEDG